MAVAVAFSLVCLQLSVTGAAATVADDSHPASQVETPTDENETQHENPDDVANEEYSEDTAAWLAQRLGNRLSNGSVSLSNGQYEQARRLLGDEYNHRLEQYVDVAGVTDGDGDDAAAREFRAARENQRSLTGAVQRYRTQYSEYQEARENGNERRARRLARQMERTASNVSRRSQRLVRNYEQIEGNTSVNVTTGKEQITATTRNLTALQRTVREETLVGTILTVESLSPTASFSNPATIAGEIRTENGTAPLVESITLRVGNRTRSVQLTSNGSFETQYRPRATPVGTQSIRVAYIPPAESVYLTDSANVTVDIEQTAPTINLTRDPAVVRYGRQLAVSATVSANEIPVDGIPIEILIDESEFTRTLTSANGSSSSTIRLPASVDNGNRSVSVRIPYQDRAIAGVNARAPLSVALTPTTLSLDASTPDGTVLVRGKLQTTDGDPVVNEPVSVRVGDTGQTTVETDASGRFEVRVDDSSVGGGQIPIQAKYAQPGSNLGNANATTTVSIQSSGAVPPPDRAGKSIIDSLLSLLLGSDSNPAIGFGTGATGVLWVLAGLIGLTVTGGILVVVNRLNLLPGQTAGEPVGSDEPTDSDESTGADERPFPALAVPHTPEGLPETSAENLDERLSEYLATNEYDAAVIVAYSAVRDELISSHDLSDTMTHWELVEHYRRSDHETDRITALRDIVEAFERAAFSPASLDATRAEEAIEAARALRRQ